MKTGGHKGILCVYLLSLPVRGAWIEIGIRKIDMKGAGTSLPVRGAWIEIEYSSVMPKVYVVSLPVRGAWIEIFKQFKIVSFISSLPVRGAWIEIPQTCTPW